MTKKSSGSGTVKKSGGGSSKSITGNRSGGNKSTGTEKRSYHPTPPKPKRGGGDKK